MNGQIRAILWAQFRVVRNVLPRTSMGTVAVWFFSALWYSIFGGIAAGLVFGIPRVAAPNVPSFVGIALLALMLYWQLFPLMTFSAGWSIELKKLLVYPIRKRTLFAMEFLLRLTNAPEAIIVLAGVIAGLMRNSAVPLDLPLLLLLYIPFNLLLAVAIRGLVTRMLSRRRLRSLALLFFVLISVLPSLIANTGLGERVKPFVFQAAGLRGVPWAAFAQISTTGSGAEFLLCAAWIAIAWWWARRQFEASVSMDVTERGGERAQAGIHGKRRLPEVLGDLAASVFRDPLGAMVEKEVLILSRSPRFRMIFAMACLFSVMIFFPLAFGHAHSTLMANNFTPLVNAYGLLIVGETLLWNCFGFDRKATQIYFVSPVPMRLVFRAKNIVAACAIAVMTAVIGVLSGLISRRGRWEDICGTILLTAVLAIFFATCGNLTSVMMPRPIDPNQAMKNQNNAKASAMLLLCTILLAIPVGLALLAKWAFGSEWPYFGILIADIVGGLILYSVVTESAVQRAERDRERILSLLSADGRPIET